MRIAAIAKRVAILEAKSLPEAGLLTYPIGALFCAFEAQRCKFTDRIDHLGRWKLEVKEALFAAGELARNKRPSESSWLAVVHFNSALHRIDAGYERFVKHITGERSSRFEDLERAARAARIPPAAIALWRKVRTGEVNRLKHEAGGALSGPRVKFQEMLKALDALVRLLEKSL
jgi:hypothetical protein